jgi:hypothetical protein
MGSHVDSVQDAYQGLRAYRGQACNKRMLSKFAIRRFQKLHWNAFCFLQGSSEGKKALV